MNLVKHYVRISRQQLAGSGELPMESDHPTTYSVSLDGQMTVNNASADTLLADLYKEHINDYPKFYKMDTLCKAGFVASELLLNAEGRRQEQWGESRGVVLFNAASSLADDRNYQATIDNPETSFPSPSLFVYTLPNVLTGEIAIRNHFFGETNFIVMPKPDCDTMAAVIDMTFNDESLQSLVTGWVDCYNESTYDVLMFIVERDALGNSNELSEEIKRLFE